MPQVSRVGLEIIDLKARHNYSAGTLPADLSQIRLRREAALGEASFLPKSEEEAIPAIFASWNVLDALMWTLSRLPTNDTSARRDGTVGRAHMWQTGYVRELQVRRMVQLVREPGVRRYCEVGMNGGHSAMAMLLANPQVKADVFDVMKLKYSQPVADLLSTSFGDRFAVHKGYSQNTLPSFISELTGNGSHCDLILVDGSHLLAGAASDLQMLRRAASPSSRLVVDDINMVPGTALLKEVNAGRVEVLEQYGPFDKMTRRSPCMRAPRGHPGRKSAFMCPKWGYAVGRYRLGKRRGGE